MTHVRKSLKPATKLIEAATDFLGSSAMSYVKKFNVSAGGMSMDSQDTTCVSIEIEMLEAHPMERVSVRSKDSYPYEDHFTRKG